jgi:mono/diheme cytochrome c family protein
MKVNLVYLYASAAALSACDRAPSTNGMKEWSPIDHDQQAQPAPQPPRADQTSETATLAALLWKQQCASCHGQTGLGDGPASIATRPPSLTSAAWQQATSDDQITKTITTGKGKMPKFDLPEAVVKALVVHIRTLGKDAPQ